MTPDTTWAVFAMEHSIRSGPTLCGRRAGLCVPGADGADGCAVFAGEAAVGVASPAVLAGVVAVGVASPAVTGAASLADAWVASLADAGVAPLANAGVAPLADAGVASLADAGVASLADQAGSVAGGVTNLVVPVCERTEEMTFLQKCVVRDCSVFDGSVYCDSEMDCGDCASPDAWCQEMPEIRDNSVCQYVNCVGSDPDFVDRTVPEGGDDCPVELLCVITDDMTYQERIEALSGTI